MNNQINFNESKFWESVWNKAVEKDDSRSEKDKIELWSKRAPKFDENVSTSSGSLRINETIKFLNNYGILNREKIRILDIGCGPGHYSIEFAKKGHEVIALDPAKGMIEQFEEKLKEENKIISDKIKVMQADWFELDVKNEGFSGYFDLVFASMCPAINNVENLKKAIFASKNYCFVSRFSGPRIEPSVQYIKEKFLGEDEMPSHMDIIYPFNWLYSKAYKPEFHYSSWERISRQTKEKAKQEISEYVGLFLEVSDEVEEEINKIVEEKEKNGYFSEPRGATVGMLLWKVDKNCIKFE